VLGVLRSLLTADAGERSSRMLVVDGTKELGCCQRHCV